MGGCCPHFGVLNLFFLDIRKFIIYFFFKFIPVFKNLIFSDGVRPASGPSVYRVQTDAQRGGQGGEGPGGAGGAGGKQTAGQGPQHRPWGDDLATG